MEVNVDVSYDGSRNLGELMNKQKPGSNGSNLDISVFDKFNFSYADKIKT